MKQQIIRLVSERQLGHTFDVAQSMPLDGTVEVVFRNAKVGKTLAQLGTLFGLWMDEICAHTGNDPEYMHKWLKMNFLAPIYAKAPVGHIQEQWSELYWYYMSKQDAEKLSVHLERLSIAHTWGFTIQQMTEYLNVIQAWAINQGCPLTVPSQFHKYYKEELNRS